MSVMDLVAGDVREIVLALSVEDVAGLADARRFEAFLSLGSGLDPTWLDEFSRAAREATGADVPTDFLDARSELPDTPTDRIVEQVDPAWISAVAALPDASVPRIAARWIDRMEAEGDEVGADEKEAVYELARDLVRFCRAARDAPDAEVLFAWSL
jgi:hypothetical protein